MTYEDARRILGVHAGASPRDIAASFRRMARKYHPDHNSSPDAARSFQAIVQARDTLLNGPTRDGLDPALEAEMNARIHEQRQARANWEASLGGISGDLLYGTLGAGFLRK